MHYNSPEFRARMAKWYRAYTSYPIAAFDGTYAQFYVRDAIDYCKKHIVWG